MKTMAIMALFIVLTLLCGCSTPKGVISTTESNGAITYNETKDGKTSPYSLSVKKDSTVVSLDFAKPEPPTLPQLCTYAQEIFDQEIKPKLDAGQTLSNEELAILACCMNIRIYMMQALNRAILASMELPLDASPTYGIVAHPKLPPMRDVAKKRNANMESNRLNAEKAFDEKMKELATQFTGEPSIEFWGKSFSGDESFTLGLDERKELLYCLLASNQKLRPDYLRRGTWKRLYDWTGLTLFGLVGEIPGAIIAYNASGKELPAFKEKYSQRIRNTKWKIGDSGYDTDLLALGKMYSDISNGVHIAHISTDNNQQFDRLCDLEKQFSKIIHDSARSQCLAEDYPFAVMLLECMKMMGYYYKREYHGHTPDKVQDKYEKVAKKLYVFTKSMRISNLHNKTLIALYENEYVKFLEKSLNKPPEELHRDELIPFLPERVK